ncbi:hypothetical protein AAT19DRAFT_15786 [Rhodotorula toruloides]|uniref:Uncharacterized protein n=1 Tax=Rhodotorula toruloides TaxID=5286 RepID=A0A2T0A4V8_RHOTO|nr:hypothetical protein AAT19DRAFT_15786 [Rhodotorula toruloides]
MLHLSEWAIRSRKAKPDPRSSREGDSQIATRASRAPCDPSLTTLPFTQVYPHSGSCAKLHVCYTTPALFSNAAAPASRAPDARLPATPRPNLDHLRLPFSRRDKLRGAAENPNPHHSRVIERTDLAILLQDAHTLDQPASHPPGATHAAPTQTELANLWLFGAFLLTMQHRRIISRATSRPVLRREAVVRLGETGSSSEWLLSTTDRSLPSGLSLSSRIRRICRTKARYYRR